MVKEFENSLIVYKTKWVIERIYAVSDRIRHKVSKQVRFEEMCIERIGEYLKQNSGNTENKAYIERMINQVAAAYVKKYKKQHAEMFSDLAVGDNEGQELEFEPLDVLADVEEEATDNLNIKEKVALLAGGDGRRQAVLNAWQSGEDNNLNISKDLAKSFGGNSESHRKFITRFRTECKRRLVTAI